MKSIFQKCIKPSFGQKLILSYIIFALVPVMGVGLFAYRSSSSMIKEQTYINIKGTLEQIKGNILYKLNTVERMSEQLFLDYDLQQVLSEEYGIEGSYEATKRIVRPRLEQLLSLPSDDTVISVYLKNETLPEIFYGDKDYPNPLDRGRYLQLYHMNRIVATGWYKQVEPSNNKPVWKQVDEDTKFQNISLVRRIITFDDLSELGFLKITSKMKDLFEAVDHQRIADSTFLFVTDEKSNIIYTSDDKVIPDNWDKRVKEYMTIEEEIPGPSWKLIALVPISQLEKNAIKLRDITLIISMIILICLFALGIVISRHFSGNIDNIVKSLNDFETGEFHKRINYSGNDEFAHIASAFNKMAGNIEELIHEVYISKLKKKETELQLLQAQINPHFLYNTLSSISRLGKLGEKDKLHHMVMSLAKFYRLSLNKGDIIMSIDKELQQIEAYVDIQKIKYGERLEVSYDIDPAVLEYDTVKFILQPFVENVQEHAWYGDKIHIRIMAYKDGDTVIFKIIDNGVGIKGEIIKRILSHNNAKTGYGIYNVDERIKLHFGKQYGVAIFSRIGIGTTVSVTIPALKEQSRG
jgi:two-component system, sensor histidine kinase YesM